MNGSDQSRGFAAIGLHNPKHHVNVGAALRAAGVYGASLLATTGRRYKAAATDVGKEWRNIPYLQVDSLFDAMPYRCVPVAVDIVTGAVPLFDFEHPERAFYIFGAEDGTLGKKITDRCKHKIYIPTPGPCMNLAAAVNVVLYDRLMKEARHVE